MSECIQSIITFRIFAALNWLFEERFGEIKPPLIFTRNIHCEKMIPNIYCQKKVYIRDALNNLPDRPNLRKTVTRILIRTYTTLDNSLKARKR